MATTVRVGMVLYDGCTLLDFAGATQVFAFAPWFEVVWLAPDVCPIETTEIVNVISGPTQSMTTQLSVQYAPDPPFHSGDPSQAPAKVTAGVLKSQESFTAAIRAGVEAVIGGD